MLDYMEYLNMPTTVIIVVVIIFLGIQIIGELIEFSGKAVPEFFKIRKYFARKKEERETMRGIPDVLANVQTLLDEVKCHYDKDNIAKRDKWIESVNKKLEKNDEWIKEMDKKLDRNREDILSLIIDGKRNDIINFASHVIDETYPVTREQFNRIFKLYKEYEEIIEKNNLTNGEINIALRIIQESYEKHMKNHTFVEDIRGYDIV